MLTTPNKTSDFQASLRSSSSKLELVSYIVVVRAVSRSPGAFVQAYFFRPLWDKSTNSCLYEGQKSALKINYLNRIAWSNIISIRVLKFNTSVLFERNVCVFMFYFIGCLDCSNIIAAVKHLSPSTISPANLLKYITEIP